MAPNWGTLVISLDFELHWGVFDKRTLSSYRQNLLGVREAIPAILRAFMSHEVAATWAMVGFLLFENKAELMAAIPERTPNYRERSLDPYALLPLIGNDEHEDPFHFAPTLAKLIADTPRQEIGTHTLSHYYCLESGQDSAAFKADLQCAIETTRHKLGVVPTSIVFPRNQFNPAYLDACAALGLRAYRGNPRSWLYEARGGDEPLWRRSGRLLDAYLPVSGVLSHSQAVTGGLLSDVPASRFLRPFQKSAQVLEPLRVRRICRELEFAARTNRMYHLWWHPHNFGSDLAQNMSTLSAILSHFRKMQDAFGMRSATMAEAAEMLS